MSNSYELGTKLHHDWKVYNNDIHNEIRNLSKSDVDLYLFKKGFMDNTDESYRGESLECFYGALDEIGVSHWYHPIRMNDHLNNMLNELTAKYLENVVGLFNEGHTIDDSDWQVVYDLKSEVAEKYLPMFDITIED